MMHLDIKIYGKVQGVFFRDGAQKKAKEFELTGYVKNEDDGTVHIEAEGEEGNLKKFLAWCYDGPPLGVVEKIEDNFSGEVKNFKVFEVI